MQTPWPEADAPGCRIATPDERMKHLAALFASMCILGMGTGLGTSLLGIRSTIEDFSSLAIGIALAGYYAGFLVGSRLIGGLLANVGHIRVFAGLASLASSAALLHALYLNPGAWLALRVLTGFCMSGIYITAESWLNNVAENRNRGRILATYMVIGMGGGTLGQLMIGIDDPGGFSLFILTSVLLSISLVPLSLTRSTPPRVRKRQRANIRAVYRVAPMALVGAAAAGLTHSSIITMGPVYGAQVGLTNTQVGQMMAALLVGAMVNMIPLGRLSDRFPRRRVILAITLGSAIVTAVMSTATTGPLLLTGVMLVYGALTFPVYALSMSHMNDLLEPAQLVPGAAALVTFMGSGAIAGPILTAGLMTVVGPHGMWITLTGLHGLFAVYILHRFVERPHIPTALQKVFAPIPVRSSARVAYLIHRSRPRKEDDGPGSEGPNQTK